MMKAFGTLSLPRISTFALETCLHMHTSYYGQSVTPHRLGRVCSSYILRLAKQQCNHFTWSMLDKDTEIQRCRDTERERERERALG